MGRPLIAVDARYGLRGERRGIGEYVYQVFSVLARMVKPYDVVLYGDGSADPATVTEFREAFPVRIMRVRPFAVWEQMAWPRALHEDAAVVTHGTANIAPLSWKGPLVLTVHDAIEWHRGREFPSSIPLRHHMSRVYRMTALKVLVRRAQVVLTVSEHARSDIGGTLGIGVDKIRVTELAAKAGTTIECQKLDYFLAMGAMDPRKNLNGVFRGFAECKMLYVRLKIVGLEARAVASAYALAARYGLEGRVDIETMVSDEMLSDLYGKALGFLYLSWYEGFGLPVLEAMAMGCPVIASNRSALPEVAGDAALLVNPDSPPEIGKNMDRLIVDGGLRTTMIRRGRERAALFSWTRTAERTHEAYLEVIDGMRRR